MNMNNEYEGLELSTQLIITEAKQRGLNVEILDGSDNFIRIRNGEKIEFIKQATRTAADTYIAPLLMENKLVTKKILAEAGIRVPAGEQFYDIKSARAGYAIALSRTDPHVLREIDPRVSTK